MLEIWEAGLNKISKGCDPKEVWSAFHWVSSSSLVPALVPDIECCILKSSSNNYLCLTTSLFADISVTTTCYNVSPICSWLKNLYPPVHDEFLGTANTTLNWLILQFRIDLLVLDSKHWPQMSKSARFR